MREYIDTNLIVIKKHFKKRYSLVSKSSKLSLMEEFKEWGEDSLPSKEKIWTLPDLTRIERLNNFCRSIKKKIN